MSATRLTPRGRAVKHAAMGILVLVTNFACLALWGLIVALWFNGWFG